MSDFFSPGSFSRLPTGHVGEGGFVRRNGLIMGAAARNLRHRDYAAPHCTPPFGAESVRTPGWASAARVKNPPGVTRFDVKRT